MTQSKWEIKDNLIYTIKTLLPWAGVLNSMFLLILHVIPVHLDTCFVEQTRGSDVRLPGIERHTRQVSPICALVASHFRLRAIGSRVLLT